MLLVTSLLRQFVYNLVFLKLVEYFAFAKAKNIKPDHIEKILLHLID
jgi:hypothetical protein